ncbi:MAG: alpha/beta fold hydrolase [Dehalococcoidia bacterium]
MFRPVLIAAALMLTGSACAEAPAVSGRVQVNGMQMYYEVSGNGDPLIVLHGAYMNIPSMGAIIPKLAQTHKVLAVLPATAHTAVITQPDLLLAFIEPFLKGETPKGFFQAP